ncbi:MAG TPA: hypothetical protein DDW20_04250 [Firmicutes bacterium]|nr:hypothetical protein [Bacillota bacterium]
MTSDTIRQKFIYNTPYDDNEFPLVLEDNIDMENDKYYLINASYLYCLEEFEFNTIIKDIKNKNIDKVIIKNDYLLKSGNKILVNASLCYIMAFVYLFKKNGIKCKVM